MSNELGAKHWLGFKGQVVPGTAETTVSHFIPTSKIKMDANMEAVPRLAYLTTGVELPARVGWIKPNGSCTAEVHASLPHPWYWALGAVETTTPSGSVKLHTITDDATYGPVPLTAECSKVFGQAKQADAYINKISLETKVGELGVIEFDWLALGHTEDATLTSEPSFTTDPLVCTAVKVSVGGAQIYTATGCKVEFDNQLEQLPVLTDASGGQPQVIRRSKPVQVTGSIDFLDFPLAYLKNMIAGTSFAFIVELQGATISGEYKQFLRITLPACLYTGGLDPEIAADVITGTAQFKGYYDTVTSKQITVEAQNIIADITDDEVS